MTRLFVTVGISVFANMRRWAQARGHAQLVEIQGAYRALLEEGGTAQEVLLLMQIVKEEFFEYISEADVFYHGDIAVAEKDIPGASASGMRPKGVKSNKNRRASAEIQSIGQVLQSEEWEEEQFCVHLLSTETELSRMAALLIEFYYKDEARIYSIDHQVIPGLQVDNQSDFLDDGFQELIGYVRKKRLSYFHQDGSNRILPALLNITGGYKGVVPVLTIAGQLLDIPIVYLYEGNDNLITIPALPFSFDWTYLELYRYYFSSLKKPEAALVSGMKSEERLFSMTVFDNEEARQFFEKEILGNALAKRVKGSDVYAITYLGRLLQQHIEMVFSNANTTFGIAIEFLFYEYLMNEPMGYKGVNYNWVIHNKNIEGRDFDLYLQPEKVSPAGHPFVVGEICSIGQLLTNEKGDFRFKSQFRKQLKSLKLKQQLPEAYFLFVYGYTMIRDWKQIADAVTYIWEGVKMYGVGALSVFTVDLPLVVDLSTNKRNPFSAIFQKKITRNQMKIQEHKDEVYGDSYLGIRELYNYEEGGSGERS